MYGYLEPSGVDPIEPTSVDERYGYETPFEVYSEEGVVEGESLEIRENSGGWASTEVWAHEDLFEEVSGHKILIWNTNPENANELTTTFEWPEKGNYVVEANIIKARDGGEFTLFLNEAEFGEIDFILKIKIRKFRK